MIRVYVGAALLLLAMLGTWRYGQYQFDAGVASLQAKLDHQRVQAAFDQAEAMDRLAQRYEKERADEIPQVAPAVVVALHTGTLRLRDEWVPLRPLGAPTGGGDGQADLRAAGAGNLVQIGAAADAQVRVLQDALNVCLGRADPPATP